MGKKKIFAKGYCFTKIFIFFLIGCLLGTYYEEFLCLFQKGVWGSRQGLIYGPFSPIYGIGVAIFVICLGKHTEKRSYGKTFLYSFFIGGITEFVTSFIGEYVFGVSFWDYSSNFLNIMGRTTIPFMLFWGLAGMILMKVIYPFVSKWIEKIPYRIGQPLYIVILIFIILDIIVTYSAFGRMAFRKQGKEPFTFIGELYDKYYDDAFMNKRFPAMK